MTSRKLKRAWIVDVGTVQERVYLSKPRMLKAAVKHIHEHLVETQKAVAAGGFNVPDDWGVALCRAINQKRLEESLEYWNSIQTLLSRKFSFVPRVVSICDSPKEKP